MCEATDGDIRSPSLTATLAILRLELPQRLAVTTHACGMID